MIEGSTVQLATLAPSAALRGPQTPADAKLIFQRADSALAALAPSAPPAGADKSVTTPFLAATWAPISDVSAGFQYLVDLGLDSGSGANEAVGTMFTLRSIMARAKAAPLETGDSRSLAGIIASGRELAQQGIALLGGAA